MRKNMTNIIITKKIEDANAVTHSGSFHADEVMATVILSKVLPDMKLCRTFRVPEGLNQDVIVYDIGGGRFDHHQRGGNGERENGVPYSSAGLIWKEFGHEVVNGTSNPELVWASIDKGLIQGIDAIDNGVMPKSEYPAKAMSISNIISSFNPNWDEDMSSDDAFMKAVAFAEVIFDNLLKSAIAKVKAQDGVEKALVKAANGIMVLEQYMPWQDFIFSSENMMTEEILYVVFPSNRGGYNVQAVPDKPGSFGQRKPLPKEWAGLRDEAIAKVSGVKTANFCHPGRFICGADKFEDALLLAKKAVES